MVLLGSIFLSKFNQVAQGRQSLSKSERHPYYIYLDEFQNFITPSITRILSGARKYGLGLLLAHQELGQIEESKTLNSVISNPHTRICFRLGDMDAKRLEQGFSYFEQSDLQSLGIGKAIMRVGSANNDFNISTFPLSEVDTETANNIKNTIVQNTRDRYTKSKAEIDKLLQELLPRITAKKSKKESIQDVQEKNEHNSSTQKSKIKEEVEASIPQENSEPDIISKTKLEKEKEKYLASVKENETIQRHRVLQNNIRTLAIQRGFKATIEQETEDGGRVDVALVKDDIRIAVEISVTNTTNYEVKNIQKCMDAGYTHVCMLSENETHLKNIKKRANTITQIAVNKKVCYLIPDKFPKYLDGFIADKKTTVKRIRGYTVKSNHIEIQGTNVGDKNNTLKEILLKSLKKGGKGKKKKK